MKPDQPIRRVLASNVQRMRELRGWSVEVLARRLKLDVPSTAAIERGTSSNVRIGVVEAIARVFHVEVTELLTSARERQERSTRRSIRKARTSRPEDRPPKRRAS